MAINKKNSPAWVRITLIILIIAFVSSLVVIAANPFQPSTSPNAPQGANSLSADDQKYQPQVASLTALLQSEPESYTVLVNLGNTYFDWASTKQQASQTTSSAAGADLPLWVAAKDAYSRAIEVKGDESAVRVDYAITLYYTGETNKAIETAEAVRKDDPTFAPAIFNLGIFYQSLGEKDKAVAAYNTYLKLDPEGKLGGNPDFAKQQLQALSK